jgi:putative transposase
MGACRTFKYLLQPTTRQRASLQGLLRQQCELYNAALEERRGAWRWEKRSVSYFDQCQTLTELRSLRPEFLEAGVTVCRGTLKRLDRAFRAFYRRCQAGQTPGYPRFKSARRFDSLQWEEPKGWRLNESTRRLRLLGVGEVKLRLHRPLRGTPRAITVARQGRRWWVSIRCIDVPARPLPATGCEVGIDLGVTVLLATSDGALVTEGRFQARAANWLAQVQRELAMKTRGSGHRRRAVEAVARAHRKVAAQRRDLAHKLSRQLVNDYDFIAMEKLKVSVMIRRPKPHRDGRRDYLRNGASAKAGLNRSIADAGWRQLVEMIGYKAEEAGRQLVFVDPRYTSQTCSQCGYVDPENRRTQAVFVCQACGVHAHADVNAAVNILRAGRARQASPCGGSPTRPTTPYDQLVGRAGPTSA